MKRTLLIPVFLVLFSCNDEKQQDVANTPVLQFKSALMPALADADSAFVLFYDQPNEPRNYRVVRLNHRDQFTRAIKEINGTTVSVVPDCKTDGKIHFYGAGEAVPTVYFTYRENCRQWYFFVGAEKYHVDMSTASVDWLNELRIKAQRP